MRSKRLAYLATGMLLVAAAGTALAWILGIFPPSNDGLLSTQEFAAMIEKCRASGGKPTPIYDRADPTRIYRVDCEKLASPSSAQVMKGAIIQIQPDA